MSWGIIISLRGLVFFIIILIAKCFRPRLFDRISKLSCVCLLLRKVVNEKHFSVKKILLGFQKSVFLLFWVEKTFQKL